MKKNNKIKIGVLNHSINIGNHFFEISIISDLQKLFGEKAEIFPVEGRHYYSDLFLTGNKEKYINYGKYTKCDYFVLAGPIFQKDTLRKNFEPLFKEMLKNGTKFIYLSAGSSHYSKEEIEDVRSFLDDYPPYVISTRDEYTFNAYHDLADFSYNGICSAFYSPFHYRGFDTPSLGDYMILNFEESSEPNLDNLDLNDYSNSSFDSTEISKCSNSSKLRFALNYFKNHKSEYKGLKIIRTLHNFNPSKMKPFINRSNQFVSVNPYAYLNLFSRAKVVLARRVHACVPALAYGNQAMLFSSSKRSKLFDRVGVPEITKRPVKLKEGLLEKEYSDFLVFLKHIKDDILSMN